MQVFMLKCSRYLQDNLKNAPPYENVESPTWRIKNYLLERKLEYSSSSFEVCLRNMSILFPQSK